MKPKVFVLLFVLAFLSSGLIEGLFVNVTRANFVVDLPYITINSDGSVEPETEYITRVSGTYFLTANLSQYAIRIQCSNIIFDGQGHCINGTVSSGGHGFGNSGVGLVGVTNVTVQNIEIMGFMGKDIMLSSCYGCTILKVKAADVELADSTSNVLFQNDFSVISPVSGITRLYLSFSNGNIFYANNISALFFNDSKNNTFYCNNFLSLALFIKNTRNYWDNGSTGNYWSNYPEKYPNVSEISKTGIGDTPYFIDADNVDNYPLMVPFKTLSPSSAPLSTLEPKLELSSIVFIVGISGLSLVGAVIGIFYYLKKR